MGLNAFKRRYTHTLIHAFAVFKGEVTLLDVTSMDQAIFNPSSGLQSDLITRGNFIKMLVTVDMQVSQFGFTCMFDDNIEKYFAYLMSCYAQYGLINIFNC